MTRIYVTPFLPLAVTPVILPDLTMLILNLTLALNLSLTLTITLTSQGILSLGRRNCSKLGSQLPVYNYF